MNFNRAMKNAVLRDASLICAGSTVEAQAIQESLRHRIITRRTINTGDIRCIAGADAVYAGDRIFAVIAALTFPGLEVVETICAARKIPFPYIPGLLAFREGPAILDAVSRVRTALDLIVLNGHGIAHPGRFGLASHVGLILDIPSIGISRRVMTGTSAVPGTARGSIKPVLDGDEVIGMAVRTVTGKKPVIVSVGHKVDLQQAVEIAVMATYEHRMTEPVWFADQHSRKCRDTAIIDENVERNI